MLSITLIAHNGDTARDCTGIVGAGFTLPLASIGPYLIYCVGCEGISVSPVTRGTGH